MRYAANGGKIMLKLLVMKYIHDSANLDAVVELLEKVVLDTDVIFPPFREKKIEDVKNGLRELGELEVLKEFEKGTFAIYP